jgi:glycosyltransferase involved in cell wall biosynthesis
VPDFQWLLAVDKALSRPKLADIPSVAISSYPGRMGWRLWYDRQLPRLAKKQGASLIMTTGGIAASSKLPQLLWMPERANPKQGQGYLPLFASRLTESLRRAAAIFCFSTRDKEWLISMGGSGIVPPVVIRPSAEAPGPLSSADREAGKTEFGGGREYFFADISGATEDEVVYLLKAFSLFKKRQLSNLPLLLKGVATKSIQTKIETYKYREDILWYEASGSGDRAMAAAYAALFLFDSRSIGVPILDAWKQRVPAIILAGCPMQELAGEAALVAEGADPASLATQFMSVYKDEALRSRLVGLGRSRLEEFDLAHGLKAIHSAIVAIKK